MGETELAEVGEVNEDEFEGSCYSGKYAGGNVRIQQSIGYKVQSQLASRRQNERYHSRLSAPAKSVFAEKRMCLSEKVWTDNDLINDSIGGDIECEGGSKAQDENIPEDSNENDVTYVTIDQTHSQILRKERTFEGQDVKD